MHTIINTKQTNIRVNIENIHAHDDESYDQNQKRMVQMLVIYVLTEYQYNQFLKCFISIPSDKYVIDQQQSHAIWQAIKLIIIFKFEKIDEFNQINF